MQDVWTTLWMKDQVGEFYFTKGFFLTTVLHKSQNAAMRAVPISIIHGDPRNRRKGKTYKGARSRETSTYPVQIFGQYIHEVTYDDAIVGAACGDE